MQSSSVTEAAIRKIAAELNIDLSDYEIINEPDKVQASLKAVKLAHDGVANMYMKGLLDTKTFLKSVLDKEVGLRTGNTLSHVAVFEVKGIEQLLFLTDVAFDDHPTLEDKVYHREYVAGPCLRRRVPQGRAPGRR